MFIFIFVEFMEIPANFNLLYNHGSTQEKKGASSKQAYSTMKDYFLATLNENQQLIGNLEVDKVEIATVKDRWGHLYSKYRTMLTGLQAQTGGGSNGGVKPLPAETKDKFPYFDRFRSIFSNVPTLEPAIIRNVGQAISSKCVDCP
jgi:hypothetical protein